jgi:hypothetical protein
MAEITFHQQELARIEHRITEIKRKIEGLHERLEMLEAAGLNPHPSHALLTFMMEHLEIMEMRREQVCRDVRIGQTIRKSGCWNER